jgi:hypothetical protein
MTERVRVVMADDVGMPRELYQQIANLGWNGLIVPRSAHSRTTATSGASANNASILRWKPDPQFQDTMRMFAAHCESRQEQAEARAVIQIPFSPAGLEECVLVRHWARKLEWC